MMSNQQAVIITKTSNNDFSCSHYAGSQASQTEESLKTPSWCKCHTLEFHFSHPLPIYHSHMCTTVLPNVRIENRLFKVFYH